MVVVWIRCREFIKDVRVGVTKVSWPTRDELRDSTIVVIVDGDDRGAHSSASSDRDPERRRSGCCSAER